VRRTGALVLVVVAVLFALGIPAQACGFLVAPNGTVQLVKTTTLAAYAEGVEHYVTSFEYAGAETDFGSIIPLPGVPTKVERGGDWTLQRLVEEVRPPIPEAFALASGEAGNDVEILLTTKIDALDITVLKGGGTEVVEWANSNGYFLPEDAASTLEFYSRRSPIFLAARFDAARAAELEQSTGDGTPIHVSIPTENPWVPLRILAMGKPGDEQVEADVFLLTERRPALLGPRSGLNLSTSAWASETLLADLRSDVGMEWVPDRMYLSHMELVVPASNLEYDLAIDQSGGDQPSAVAAGITSPLPERILAEPQSAGWLLIPFIAIVGLSLAFLLKGAGSQTRL